MRLDRLVGKWGGWGKRQVRERFDAGAVRFNGMPAHDRGVAVGKFDRVEVGGEVVQARDPRYVLMNKPSGVVSATRDANHATVIDLIDEDWVDDLHLAGRLDRFTTGLVILTNDSRFSESLTGPERLVGKRYHVKTGSNVTAEAIAAFRKGMWLAKEEVATAPAGVELLGSRRCRLTIYEGKHHQVKRMFARFGIKVVALHREAIGAIELPGDLKPGEWREFTGPSGSRS